MKLRHILTLLTFNVVLFAAVFFAANFWAKDRLLKTRAQFLTQEQTLFYKKYTAELNHLRAFEFQHHMYPDAEKSTTDFLFSKVGDGKQTILIQGDSWAEQMILGYPSFFAVQIFSEENDTRVIVGGTTSYSPSIMTAQYRIMRDDFAIHPEIVVGIIDQTDIGDELCRYRKQRSKNKEGEEIVRPYDGTTLVPYQLTSYFDLIDILDAPGIPLIKLIKYRLAKSKKLAREGCHKEIVSPLEGQLTYDDRQYFKERVRAYIDEVFRASPQVKTLILVTHFHAKHLTGEYQISVSEIINECVSSSSFKDRIVQLDFRPEDYLSEDLRKIFKEGDPFFHLTDHIHRKIFTKNILHKIRDIQNQ